MSAIDRLLGVADDIDSCRNVLIAKVGGLAQIAGDTDELAGRERIEHFAPRLGIGGDPGHSLASHISTTTCEPFVT